MIRMDVVDPDQASIIKHVRVGAPAHYAPPLLTLRQLKEKIRAGEGADGAKTRFNRLQRTLRGRPSLVLSHSQTGAVLGGW